MNNLIDLNHYKKNIYHKLGIKKCPSISEDGVILKIFEKIKINSKPNVIEFGEHRTLGTTTRAFRIKYLAKSLYFAGNYSFYSFILNVLDIIKISLIKFNLKYFYFFLNMPFKFYVTPKNIINLLKKYKFNKSKIDIISVDIDSFDYFIVQEFLKKKFHPSLFIIEYNWNIPLNLKKTISYPFKTFNNNKKIYGASYSAIVALMNKYNYNLIFISGFCNLFFVENKNSKYFTKPNLTKDMPQSNEQIIDYCNKFCIEKFLPSWLEEKTLSNKDLSNFIDV